MKFRSLSILVLAWAVFPDAHAGTTEYCVADSQTLELALIDASNRAALFEDEENSIIKVVQNATPYQIDLDITFLDFTFDSLVLRGGFVSGCGSQTHDVSKTVLQFLGRTEFQVLNDFEVSDFTVKLDATLFVLARWSDIVLRSNHLILTNADESAVRLRRSVDSSDSSTYTVVNNVITASNGLQGGNDACALRIYNGFAAGEVYGPGEATVMNNTIAGTGGAGVCLSRLTSATFTNNIIQGTTTASIRDVDTDKSVIKLYHNFLEDPMQGVQYALEQGTVASPPSFVDAASGNFRLLQASEAVNSGYPGFTDSLPNFDLDGNPRKVGTLIDHGAYENSFDDSTPPIVVTTNADVGDCSNPDTCSLRDAIVDANAMAGPQRIVIDLGSGPNDCGPAKAIELQTPLPDITDDLEIDGYGGLATPNDATFGFNANLCVVLSEAEGATVPSGLNVPNSAGGVKLQVKGIHFINFSSAAISLFGGDGHVIQGNRFGAGLLNGVNSNGVGVQVGSGVDHVLIGGSDKASRNMIGTSNSAAIRLFGNMNTVVNNLIGPGPDGLASVTNRNATGMVINGSTNFVERNTISGNLSHGLQIQGNGNSVRDNLIGVNDGKRCTGGVGTCQIDNAQGNDRGVLILGDDNIIHRNLISHSTNQGLAVANGATGNRLRSNEFINNGGLGVDLRNDGLVEPATTPEFFEAPESANGGQNQPVLTTASGTGGSGTVVGSLSSRKGTYGIELYANFVGQGCDASGYGEGNVLVGSGTVTIAEETLPANGTADFTIPVFTEDFTLLDKQITALVTSSAGNTSEFSNCVTLTQENSPPTFDALSLAMPRSTPANTVIATLTAIDDGLPAPANLTFTLLTGSARFALTPDGTLSVTQANIFDVASSYVIDVEVSDGEKSTTNTVTIRPTELFRDGFEAAAP